MTVVTVSTVHLDSLVLNSCFPERVLVKSGKAFETTFKASWHNKTLHQQRLIRFFQLLQAGFGARFPDLTPPKLLSNIVPRWAEVLSLV